MIRIGDFSKLSRVPVKTLRYYDEMGLLKPVEVDSLTGYRLAAPHPSAQGFGLLTRGDRPSP
jgi:hypothetical protein